MEIVHVGSKIDVTLAVCHEGNVGSPVTFPFTMSHLNKEAFDQVCAQVEARRAEMLQELVRQSSPAPPEAEASVTGESSEEDSAEEAPVRSTLKKKPNGSRR